jgi:hypothetical protein
MSLCPLTLEKSRDHFWSCLDSLSHGMNLFGVADSETGELEFDPEKVFENSNDYAVILGDLSIAENEFASQFKWLPNPENSIEIDKNLIGQGLISHNQIQIVGDIDQGIRLREQLYFFGMKVGNHLLHSSLDQAQTLVFEHPKLNVATLISSFADSSNERGQYELFEIVDIGSAYSPTDGHHKVFDEMKLPKGVKRNQRKGQLTLRWSSMFTPNGMPLWFDELQLDVISDEKGFFKISGFRWVYN